MCDHSAGRIFGVHVGQMSYKSIIKILIMQDRNGAPDRAFRRMSSSDPYPHVLKLHVGTLTPEMVGESLLAKMGRKRWVAICSLPCDRVDSLLRGPNFCVIECELGHTPLIWEGS